MASNLATFLFSRRPDVAISELGWTLASGATANALEGGDQISAKILDADESAIAILNDGTIDAGAGDDLITGTVTGEAGGVGIYNDIAGLLTTAAGSDVIMGISTTGYGIINFSTIDTGLGADAITGIGESGPGIDNSGRIDTGAGRDSISGISTGVAVGLVNITIEASATIRMGAGSDIIAATSFTGVAIYNTGRIDTGSGHDTVTAFSTNNQAILNDGVINLGAGRDTLDAVAGGFAGTGTTLLGDGSDLLTGFGSGYFDGGSGRDRILFSEGVYAIAGTTIISGGNTMHVSRFEQLGGLNGGLFKFADGVLTVDAFGVATFEA
ncbi:MAG: hypothetical protein ACKO5M_03830 [Vulcanococcus sp.]